MQHLEAPKVGALCALSELEFAHIQAVVNRVDTLTEAALVLGINPATLYRKRQRWLRAGMALALPRLAKEVAVGLRD